MNCPRCNGNGEVEMSSIVEFLEEGHNNHVVCVYCGGTGYLETVE